MLLAQIAAAWQATLDGWAGRRGPLYIRLATALRAAIQRGEIGSGTRLPSERALAEALNVSRTTVAGAYELLRAEELLESRPGSGTSVARSGALIGPAVPNTIMPALKTTVQSNEMIDCVNTVMQNVDFVPDQALGLRSVDVRLLAEQTTYEPQGMPRLRSAIAERYTTQGLATSPDEILITTGAQQAIELVFSLFGRDGGVIGVESPTYFGAVDAAHARGAGVASVAMDQDGIDPRSLSAIMERAPVSMLYLMPVCHNPTGISMSQSRRREVLALAAASGTTIVEDNALADLVFSSRRDLGLAGLSSGGRVVSIGSLSKVFWAGLRIGWIRAPALLMVRLSRLKVVSDLGSSQVSQALALHLLDSIDAASVSRRRQLRERCDLLIGLLLQQLPSWSLLPPTGGPALWIELPYGNGEAFADVAAHYGVRVLPGNKMSVSGAFANYLRVSFVAPPSELVTAAERLATAWKAYESMTKADQHRLRVVV